MIDPLLVLSGAACGGALGIWCFRWRARHTRKKAPGRVVVTADIGRIEHTARFRQGMTLAAGQSVIVSLPLNELFSDPMIRSLVEQGRVEVTTEESDVFEDSNGDCWSEATVLVNGVPYAKFRLRYSRGGKETS